MASTADVDEPSRDGDETLELELGPLPGVSLGLPARLILTIIDNDGPPATATATATTTPTATATDEPAATATTTPMATATATATVTSEPTPQPQLAPTSGRRVFLPLVRR